MRCACSGFTMMEVLVALLLVGAGALAMAMLQLQTLRGNRDSALQACAAAMVQELAELRVAYRAAAPEGDDPYLFTLTPASSADRNVDDCAHGCDAAGFAEATIAEWRARLRRELPGARAVVCRDGSADPRASWRCDDDINAPVIAKLGWRDSKAGAPAAQAAPLMALTLGR